MYGLAYNMEKSSAGSQKRHQHIQGAKRKWDFAENWLAEMWSGEKITKNGPCSPWATTQTGNPR
jgi:hypothetical protein